jgi:hypothetical protein
VSDAATNGPVPDPAKPPRGRLRLPEAAWPGRVIFFCVGAVTSLAAFAGAAAYSVSAFYARPRGPEWPGYVIALLPQALSLALVVRMRGRRGKRWRWLSFLTGAIAGPLTLAGVARLVLR